MSRSAWPLLVLLFVGLALGARPIQADTTYYVAGSETVVGNNACGLNPCTATVDFSFDLGWQPYNPISPLYSAYVTNVTANWSGALGAFSQTLAGPSSFLFVSGGVSGPCSLSGDFNYLPFFDAGGDEIDINLCNNLVPAPVAPFISSAGQLYGCGTTVCVTDFSHFPGVPPLQGILLPGSVEATVVETAVPEPKVISLLGLGILALALVGAKRKILMTHQSSLRTGS